MSLSTLLTDPTSYALPAARALVHFLWQGALVAALAATVLAFLRRSRPSSRYAVALAGLVLMAAMPFVTLTLLPAADAASAASADGASVPGVAVGQSEVAPATPGFSAAESRAGASLLTRLDSVVDSLVCARPDLWVGLWGLGVALLLAIHAGGVLRLRRILVGSAPAPADWQQRLDRLARSVGVRGSVRLRQSGALDVPMVAGWLRPVIVVPASAFFGLAPEQLEAILGHELAHVRRGDFLVNLFQVAMETVFFYHPGVWWLSRRLRIEREHYCDDLAVTVFDAPLYVRALATLEQMRSAPGTPGLAMGADGGSLLARVRRLAGQGTANSGRPGLASQILGTALAALLAAGLAAAGVYLADTGTVGAAPVTSTELQEAAESQEQAEPQEQAADADKDRQRADVRVHIDWSESGDWVEEDARDLRAAAAGTRWSGLGDDTFQQLARWGFDEELFAVLERAGVDAKGDELESLARYGIDEDLLAALAATDLPADVDTLTSFGRYGLDDEDLLEYQRAGAATSAEDVLRLARHGVDGDDVEELARAGFAGLSVDELVELARHGIDGGDITELRRAGLGDLSLDEIRDMARHGVDGDEVQELRDAGFSALDVDQILVLARHGIDGDEVKELRAAGLGDLTVDQAVSLARYGIDGDEVEDVRRAGYEVSFDEVMRLARSGRLWDLDGDWNDDDN